MSFVSRCPLFRVSFIRDSTVYISSGLVAWVKAKDEELLRAEAVAGIPDGIQTQITETQVSNAINHTNVTF